MLELKGEYYYNAITIKNLVTDEVLYGKIFINDDKWCEGIIEFGSEQHLIVGMFNKYENLKLYEITKNNIYKYIATKGYLQYDGFFEELDNGDSEIPFYLKCRQLRQDPRDSGCTHETNFLQELEIFKQSIFKNKNIKVKYDYILSNKDKILKSTKVKQKTMVI